jgi:hypothetical protein
VVDTVPMVRYYTAGQLRTSMSSGFIDFSTAVGTLPEKVDIKYLQTLNAPAIGIGPNCRALDQIRRLRPARHLSGQAFGLLLRH